MAPTQTFHCRKKLRFSITISFGVEVGNTDKFFIPLPLGFYRCQKVSRGLPLFLLEAEPHGVRPWSPNQRGNIELGKIRFYFAILAFFPLIHLIILLIGTHARFQKKAGHAHSIVVGANVEGRVSKAGPFFDISTVIHLRGKIQACIGILMTYRNVSEKKREWRTDVPVFWPNLIGRIGNRNVMEYGHQRQWHQPWLRPLSKGHIMWQNLGLEDYPCKPHAKQ